MSPKPKKKHLAGTVPRYSNYRYNSETRKIIRL